MKISIGNDHAAPALKKIIVAHLEQQGHEVVNYGVDSADRVDYPDIAKKVANSILTGETQRGILLCGTGLGMSISANKVKGIRAGCVSDTTSSHLASEHNHCQIICLGARICGDELAKDIVDAFISAQEMAGRHQDRVNKIIAIEQDQDLSHDKVVCSL